jgi:hypothetical protein
MTEMTEMSTERSTESPVVLNSREHNKQVYHVPEPYWKQANEQVQVLFSRYVGNTFNIFSLGLVPVEEDVPLTGSRVLDGGSHTAYKRMARAVRHLACLTGDYQSLLMLLKRPPADKCPSIDPKLLALLCQFKSNHNRGKPLLDASKRPIKYVRIIGEVGELQDIICAGGWRNDSSHFQLKSAMTAIHTANGQYGTYRKKVRRLLGSLDKRKPF